MKKYLFIAIFGLIILVLGVGFWVGKKRLPTQSEPIPKPEEVAIETPLEERPFVSLVPRADGREFTLEIERIKNARTVEYELVYLSQGLSRGMIGSVDLLEGETSISRKLLLGTCSRGVCKYDEGVKKGTLTLRFRGAKGARKFTTEFHLQQGEKELTSADGNFKLKGQFSPHLFYLTMSTIGLPEEIKGEVITGPYGVFASGSQKVKKGKVEVVLKEESMGAKIYFWSSKGWQELNSEIERGTISAPVEKRGVWLVVRDNSSYE